MAFNVSIKTPSSDAEFEQLNKEFDGYINLLEKYAERVAREKRPREQLQAKALAYKYSILCEACSIALEEYTTQRETDGLFANSQNTKLLVN
jgi:hypothetical protein|tara:strand:+ start:1693 stop:1968 length:276 start_codon:yes stop_codon:yes gene_type:complete